VIAAALQIADAGANTTGAGPLTLILPLVLLIVVLAFWWIGLRRRRGATGDAVGTEPPPGQTPPT